MIADLHLHSIRSDGALSPRGIVGCCKANGIKLISLTDHDTVSGVREAVEAGIEKGVKVIPGIELSSFRDSEVHILGYNIAYESEGFLNELRRSQERREKRNLTIIENLRKIGININYDSIRKEVGSLGRIHIALLMKEGGYVSTVSEAFDKYIGFGCPCYEESPLIKPEEAIKLVLDYGGVPVLAHPYRYVEEGRMREFIETLPGIMGIEVYYPLHTTGIREELINIANEKNLIITGGSDFHSAYAGSPLGSGNYVMDDKAKEILGII